MECAACHHRNAAENRFCVNCGNPLRRPCPSCGTPAPPDQKFCGTCGFDLGSAGATTSPAAYTPDHLARRILAEGRLMAGERKRVTVLFADVVGSTAAIESTDPEEAAELLTAATGGMAAAVHRYEGTVTEMLGDGIMALFGAPLAHEDHAVRACRAALDIPAEVAGATGGTIETRVGLHSGEVFVQGIGTDLSVEYQALGATVHLAARMEHLATPGAAWMTAATRFLTEGAVESRSAGLHEAKGISHPVEAFEVVGIADVTPWEVRAGRGLTAFVGRDREMTVLAEAARRVAGGSGLAVGIMADAGVGKSRLVHEFVDDPAVATFRLLRSAASPYETNTAWHPVRLLLEGWLRDETSGDPSIDGLRAALAGLGLDLALPALASLLDLPTGEPWRDLTPEDRRKRIREAVRAWVLALAGLTPLLVVVEDLHWIDGETHTVLDDLVDVVGGSPLLLLFTHRPAFEHHWDSRTHYTRLRLESLSPDAAAVFVEALVGDDPSIGWLEPRLVERSERIPLFLEESVRSLVDAGVLTGERGRYRATEGPSDVDIPDSVQAVIAARIDRLAPEPKRILQAAAVVGDVVPRQQLAAAAGVGDGGEALDRHVGELQTREFLYEHAVLPVPRYRFGHALVRDVAYASLPIAERRRLHARLVDLLEDSGGDEGIERLAYHAVHGELWRKAADYSLEAGNRAIDQTAYREAVRFMRDAIGAIAHLPQDRETVERAIDVRLRLRVADTGSEGGLDRVARDLAEAAEMAAELGDDVRRTQVALHRGYVATMQGDPRLAVSQGNEALALADDLGDRYLATEARLLLTQAASYAGRVREIPDLIAGDVEYLAGELRYERKGQTMIRSVVACSHLAIAHGLLGEFADAHRYAGLGTEIADEAARPFDGLFIRFAHGVVLDMEGEHDDAVAVHDEAAAIGDANDLWFIRTFVQPWRGHAMLSAGRPEEALALLTATAEVAARVDLVYIRSLAEAFAAEARRRAGDPDGARDGAGRMLAFGRDRELPIIELAALRTLGCLDGAAGIPRLEEAAGLAERLGIRPWLVGVLRDLATAMSNAGRLDRAHRARREAARLDAEMERTKSTG